MLVLRCRGWCPSLCFSLPPFTLLLCILLAPSLVQASVKIERSATYYEVSGQTADAIRQSLNSRSPVRFQGRQYDAFTRWHIRWNFRWRPSGGICRMTRVTVSVEIRQTLPRLKQPWKLPTALQQHWRDYDDALQRHENGHADLALRAADEIDKALAGLQAPVPCDRLSSKANSLGERILQEYIEKEKDFDRETRYGARDGALFP